MHDNIIPALSDPASATANHLARMLAELGRRDPYLGAQLVVGVTILLDLSLTDRVTIGPFWLMPAVEGALFVGLTAISMHASVRNTPLRRRFALALIGFVSLVNLVSLGMLVHQLLTHGPKNGQPLIASGAVLWVTNVLLFGLWYWELDRGGPLDRARGVPDPADFLFPQMTAPGVARRDWEPGLIDYLYVSFTNATAFSPTDTMPLTRQAKSLMAVQALASLVTLGLVVARAVNILQ